VPVTERKRSTWSGGTSSLERHESNRLRFSVSVSPRCLAPGLSVMPSAAW
jgi:hypothetical protein